MHDRFALGGERELGAVAHVPGGADLDRPATGRESADVRLPVRIRQHRREAAAAVRREIDEEDLGTREVPALGALDLDRERRRSSPILRAGDRRQEKRREKKGHISHVLRGS